jgi:hypothetical protein
MGSVLLVLSFGCSVLRCAAQGYVRQQAQSGRSGLTGKTSQTWSGSKLCVGAAMICVELWLQSVQACGALLNCRMHMRQQAGGEAATVCGYDCVRHAA